jgi:carboxylate-amine ligase
MKDLWWDLRPSPGYGTLEIRVCDGPASVWEMEAIVAFMHLLASWYFELPDDQRVAVSDFPNRWIVRENKWRVLRHGLDAQVIVDREGNTQPIRTVIEHWLEQLSPIIHSLHYGEQMQGIRRILAEGNSAHRQRQVFAETGSLLDVMRQNVRDCMER